MNMKIIVPMCLAACLASSAEGGPAEGQSSQQAVLRVHVQQVFGAGYPVIDSDFVITRPVSEYGEPSPQKGAIVGYVISDSPSSDLRTTFWRGAPSKRAIETLRAAMEALSPLDLPSACTLDAGPGRATSGTYELTVYAYKRLTITFANNPPADSQCPDRVATLLQLVNTFIELRARGHS